jgi:hypothetical protein
MCSHDFKKMINNEEYTHGKFMFDLSTTEENVRQTKKVFLPK